MWVKEKSEKADLKINIKKINKKTEVMAFSPITSWKIDGEKVEAVADFISLASRITLEGYCSHEIKGLLILRRKARWHIKKQRHHFGDKSASSQSYGFSSSHVQMWELNHKLGWMPKIDAFELWCWKRLLRVPWTARRSNQSILKEIGPEYSLEGLTLKLKLQYLWPRDVKSLLIGKDPEAGKDWRQKKKGVTEDEMVGWHHWLNGHEFEKTPGDGEGQGSLACCSPWGHRELDMTQWLNNNNSN